MMFYSYCAATAVAALRGFAAAAGSACRTLGGGGGGLNALLDHDQPTQPGSNRRSRISRISTSRRRRRSIISIVEMNRILDHRSTLQSKHFRCIIGKHSARLSSTNLTYAEEAVVACGKIRLLLLLLCLLCWLLAAPVPPCWGYNIWIYGQPEQKRPEKSQTTKKKGWWSIHSIPLSPIPKNQEGAWKLFHR